MSDGADCKCAAWNSSECGCDADWTPQETIDLRVENTSLLALLKEMSAEIEELTKALALEIRERVAAEQKIVEKDMEISKLKEGILLLREQLTNPRR